MCAYGCVYIKSTYSTYSTIFTYSTYPPGRSCSIFRKYQKVTRGRWGGNKMAIPTFLIFVERLSRPNRDLTASSLLSKCKQMHNQECIMLFYTKTNNNGYKNFPRTYYQGDVYTQKLDECFVLALVASDYANMKLVFGHCIVLPAMFLENFWMMFLCVFVECIMMNA